MPPYFDTFGADPVLSSHAWRHLRERGVTVTALQDALAREPRSGTTVGTVINDAEELTVIVDRATGEIVTLWWSR
jgi:hypothetical protein